jgi:hypothetical protein
MVSIAAVLNARGIQTARREVASFDCQEPAETLARLEGRFSFRFRHGDDRRLARRKKPGHN